MKFRGLRRPALLVPGAAPLGPSPRRPGLFMCRPREPPPAHLAPHSLKSCRVDRPETRLPCLFTKHRAGPLGSPPPSRPSTPSGEERSPAHSEARPAKLHAHLQRMATRRSIRAGSAATESLARHKEELSAAEGTLGSEKKGNLLKHSALLVRTLGNCVRVSFPHPCDEAA